MRGADYFIQAAYLAASVLFILGLKSLTKPDSARRGMQQAISIERDRRADQRFENWKLRRAFMRPYFLRSTTRLSRVRKPPFLRAPRNSGSK